MDPQKVAGMKLVGKNILDDFIRKHTEATDWIANWVADVEGSIWITPQDIKIKYQHASFLSGNFVIFNVKGNKYRLEVKVAYKTTIVKVVWAGTHNEYDKRNKKR